MATIPNLKNRGKGITITATIVAVCAIGSGDAGVGRAATGCAPSISAHAGHHGPRNPEISRAFEASGSADANLGIRSRYESGFPLANQGVAMRQREIHDLGDAIFRRTLRLPRAPLRTVKGGVVVGWDSEFDAEGPLTQQLAAFVDGEMRSAVIEARRPFDSIEHFIHDVLRPFLLANDLLHPDARARVRVVLVAHFSQAELSGFADPLRQWTIRQVAKAHHASASVQVDGVEWRIDVVDLFSFFKTSLDAIGRFVGLAKLDLDRTRIRHYYDNERDRFDEYAKRDAEIALLAFSKFRDELLTSWGVDPIVHRTASSVGSVIFRHHFLKRPATPIRVEREKFSRKTVAGWKSATRNVVLFDGEIGARLAAMRAGWGGRVEAYVRGLVVRPLVEMDVVGLYPHAAILQPLPNDRTQWRRVRDVVDIETHEGFGAVEFDFPDGVTFPCLPVSGTGETKLYFPRRGISHATFSEMRVAHALGAKLTSLRDAWGFVPTAAEREHDLALFMKEMIRRKALAAKGSVGYEVAKLVANSFVGKLWERAGRFDLLEARRQLLDVGLDVDALPALWRSGRLRAAFRRRADVGSAWSPEWATLILGRARALMADIVASSKPLLVSTDSVIVEPGATDACSAVQALRGVGSDLTVQHKADAVFIARSREYALLKRAGSVDADSKILARDDVWAVIRVARHGSAESPAEFARTVLVCLREGRDVAVPVAKRSLASAERAAKEGRRLNEEVERIVKTTFTWDGKRRLVDRDVNPFTSFSGTEPYATLAFAQRADRERSGEPRRAARARSRQRLDRVLHLLALGHGVREVARFTNIPRSTVSDIQQRRRASTDPAATTTLKGEIHVEGQADQQRDPARV